MNRLHRGTLDLAAGWMTTLMSQLDRALGPTSFEAGHGSNASAALDTPDPVRPRILVADDNPCHLGVACDLLGCWGITPTLAADGAEAVALACRGGFDLILMDLQMPVMDGLEATKQIRVYEYQKSCARVPVLAYTSCVLEEDVLRDCGVDGVLEKPCSASALHECLQRWCAPAVCANLETHAVVEARSQR